MFHNIYYISTFIMLDVYVGVHLFAHHLQIREYYYRRLSISFVFCLCTIFLLPKPMSLWYSVFLYLFILTLAAASLIFCYKESGWTILFLTITGYTIHHLAYCIYECITALSSLHHIHLPFLIPYLCSVIPVYSLCYRFFSRPIKQYKKIRIDNKKMLVLSGVAIFIDIFIGLFIAPDISNEFQPIYICVMHVAISITCILILAMQFSLLANKNLESELLIMYQLLAEEKKQFKMSKENIQLINLKCHDLKYQIRKLRNNEHEVDKNVLKDIENAVGIYDSVVHTSNDALNVILTEKSLICEKEHIKITCMIDSGTFDFISATDIYSLFGNALDNAIEAVRRLSDPDSRNISLNVRCLNNFLAIHIENYFDGVLNFTDGLPETSKDSSGFHGFGMKSMRMIAEKYDGYLTASTENQIFHLNIMIPVV